MTGTSQVELAVACLLTFDWFCSAPIACACVACVGVCGGEEGPSKWPCVCGGVWYEVSWHVFRYWEGCDPLALRSPHSSYLIRQYFTLYFISQAWTLDMMERRHTPLFTAKPTLCSLRPLYLCPATSGGHIFIGTDRVLMEYGRDCASHNCRRAFWLSRTVDILIQFVDVKADFEQKRETAQISDQ